MEEAFQEDDEREDEMNWKTRICEKIERFQKETGKCPNVIINPDISRKEMEDELDFGGDEEDTKCMKDLCSVTKGGDKIYEEFEEEKNKTKKYKEECLESWCNKEGGEIYGLKIKFDDKVVGEVIDYEEET